MLTSSRSSGSTQTMLMFCEASGLPGHYLVEADFVSTTSHSESVSLYRHMCKHKISASVKTVCRSLYSCVWAGSSLLGSY